MQRLLVVANGAAGTTDDDSWRHADRDDVLVVRGRQCDVQRELEEAVASRTLRVQSRAWSVLVPQ